MIFDSEVDFFNINNNQLLSTLPKKEKVFLILRFTFFYLYKDLLYNLLIL